MQRIDQKVTLPPRLWRFAIWVSICTSEDFSNFVLLINRSVAGWSREQSRPPPFILLIPITTLLRITALWKLSTTKTNCALVIFFSSRKWSTKLRLALVSHRNGLMNWRGSRTKDCRNCGKRQKVGCSLKVNWWVSVILCSPLESRNGMCYLSCAPTYAASSILVVVIP